MEMKLDKVYFARARRRSQKTVYGNVGYIYSNETIKNAIRNPNPAGLA